MTTKGGQKKPQGSRTAGPTLNPYELQRLRQCMSNSKRMEELGISWIAQDLHRAMAPEKRKRPCRNSEESGSEYDPTLDDTNARDLMDVDSAKTSEKGSKKANTQTSDVPASGVKFRSRKRVFAPPAVCTRSTKSNPQPNASLTASDLRAAIEDAGISLHDENTNMTTGADISLHDQNTNMTTGGDISLHDQNTNMTTGEVFAQQDGHTAMAEGNHADGNHAVMTNQVEECNPGANMGHGLQGLRRSQRNGFAQQDDHTAMVEGADVTHPNGNHAAMNNQAEEEWNRGTNMGHGLQRMSRARRGKLRVAIPEGHTRPVVPLVAAKFATECNIIVRNHIPVFTHWKAYKRDPQWFDSFRHYLQAKFEIDIEDPIVKKACLEMMKTAVLQQRHRLKRDYFDTYPLHLVPKTSPVKSMTNEQWIALVESWKSPKKMDECNTNRNNRSKVQFPQTTGSRSYEVFIENIGDKYKDEEPTALDLFKECHLSRTNGFKPAVQAAIAEMENNLSAPTGSEGIEGGEGSEQPKTVNEVVHDVLSNKTKKNKFLQNVGIQIERPTCSVENPQPDLAAENAELRAIVSSQRAQLEELSKEVQ
ncbi:unnamed protein product [Urochloa decumbens]|uniref:Transposase n=1 Tax=Urochloa decumbens TaxID=240449 RepID=A0ABC9EHY7_9POAL